MTALEKELTERLAASEKLNRELYARIDALEATIARLTRNSSNSSRPPSSNPPGNPAQKKKLANRKKRKRGGQPGHKGKRREFLQPDEVKHLVPASCSKCKADFVERDANPARHQQIDVPPVKPIVTDYFCHTLKCRTCGHKQSAALPDTLATGAFGPNICAVAGLLSGRYRLSKRLICEMMQDVFGVSMALGSVSNIEQRLSSALVTPVVEAAAFVRAQKVVHADETGWTEDKRKAWMWVVACATVAVFTVDVSRGSDVARRLIGDSEDIILVSDRWGGYAWLDATQRQLCWSHLLRDFQSWIDDDRQGAVYGKHLTTRVSRIFALWRAMKRGEISRETLRKKMQKHQIMVGTYLDEASICGDSRTEAMAKRMLKLESALWTFIHREGVDPTNNYAERLIRPAVIWRKVSFGTDSAAGSRFVERMLTVVSTLRLQSRNVLEYVRDVLIASGKSAQNASLLPA